MALCNQEVTEGCVRYFCALEHNHDGDHARAKTAGVIGGRGSLVAGALLAVALGLTIPPRKPPEDPEETR